MKIRSPFHNRLSDIELALLYFLQVETQKQNEVKPPPEHHNQGWVRRDTVVSRLNLETSAGVLPEEAAKISATLRHKHLITIYQKPNWQTSSFIDPMIKISSEGEAQLAFANEQTPGEHYLDRRLFKLGSQDVITLRAIQDVEKTKRSRADLSDDFPALCQSIVTLTEHYPNNTRKLMDSLAVIESRGLVTVDQIKAEGKSPYYYHVTGAGKFALNQITELDRKQSRPLLPAFLQREHSYPISLPQRIPAK